MAKPSKRELILDAATRLFSRYGVRGTTMEAIAQEAGVAKPTAYAYFSDKEEVFLAVCERVAEGVLEGTTRAIAGKKSVKKRVTDALLAKFGVVFALVYGSPHAKEILESTDTHARKLFEDTDARYIRMLARALEGARLPKNTTPRRVAEILFASADGISSNVKSLAELESKLEALVDWIL